MPKMPILSYNLFYAPKQVRQSFNLAVYFVKISYLNKGDFLYFIPKGILPLLVKNKEFVLSVSKKKDKYKLKPYLIATIINLLGLTFRFKVFVRVKGLGYKAYVLDSGKILSLKLGLSHVVNFKFNFGMFATKLGQKDRMFSVEGNNWIILTNTLSRIRHLRKIDYYRGKGIFKKFFICKIRVGKKKKK